VFPAVCRGPVCVFVAGEFLYPVFSPLFFFLQFLQEDESAQVFICEMRRPWYFLVLRPIIVEEAYPPMPFGRSHSSSLPLSKLRSLSVYEAKECRPAF